MVRLLSDINMTALKNQYVTLKSDIHKNNAIPIYLMFDTKKGLFISLPKAVKTNKNVLFY